MTPEQISALAAIATILKTVGSVPFGLVLVIMVIGPWVSLFMALGMSGKRADRAIGAQNARLEQVSREFRDHVAAIVKSQERRFEEVVRMYENNAGLVRDYAETCTRMERLYGETISVISLNTQAQANLLGAVKNNQFCPIVRGKAGTE